MRELVRQLGEEGGTVIYSTHQLADAQRVCNRIVIIHNGEVRADGTPESLLEQTGTQHLEEAYVSLTSDVARPRTKTTNRFQNGRRGGARCSRPRRQEVAGMSSATARVRTIAKKELVEFVRDWRTIVAILDPLLCSQSCSFSSLATCIGGR